MRLHPAATKEEIQALLSAQAALIWGPERASELTGDLDTLAEAMAIVSAIELPDDLEPLFP